MHQPCDGETIENGVHFEAPEGVRVMEEEQAAAVWECLDLILAALAPNIVDYRNSHTEAETVLGVKADFVNRAYLDLAMGAGTSVVANYAAYGASLLALMDARKRIAELEDDVAFRDSVIATLWDIEEQL